MHGNEKNNCLRESSRMRTLLACESSEQPSTASIPHIVMIKRVFEETKKKPKREEDWIKCEEDKEKKKTRKTRCKECGITNT